jgi:prophage tail gpP-like protein
MPLPNDRIVVSIGGKAHADWKTYDLDSDLLTPADAFNLTLGAAGDLPPEVDIGAAVTVRLGGDLVLSGVLDEIDEEVSKTSHGITLSGRDLAGQLLDCSAPVFSARQDDLPGIVKKIVAPFGITQVKVDAAEVLTRTKVNIEPGDTAWDALAHAAEANGLWPWFTPDGVLVVGRPDYQQATVADLVLNRSGRGNNVLNARRTRSLSGLHSEVTVLGQRPGTATDGASHDIRETCLGSRVSRHRPKIVIDHECDSRRLAQFRANKLMSDGVLSSQGITVRVAGHRIVRPDQSTGLPWSPGMRVNLTLEPLQINGIWFVIGRRFQCGRDGAAITELRLKEDGIWQIDAHPHNGRHRRGSHAL